MRVLLLTHHYPPDPAVGAIRPARLAAALAGRGHAVDVVTAGWRGASQMEESSEGPTRVHRIRPWTNPRHWLSASSKRVANIFRRPEPVGPRGAAEASPREHGDPSPGLIKRQIYSLLWLPDDRQGFIPPAVHLALRLHRERPYDVMVTTAPPQTLHLCGLIVSRLRNLPWVMEYRDPWQGGKAANVVTWWSGALERRWEASALRRAASVVTVTDALATVLRERVKDPGKVVAVLNGIPPAHPPLRTVPSGTFQILHTGTVYSRRDPRPLFRALRIVRERLGPEGRPFVVDFVGLSWQYQGRSLMDWALEEGVQDLVNLRHAVRYDECQGMIGGADLLLLLAQHQPLQVPNKLYDYLAASRPILALLDEQGESARLLRAAGSHLLVPVEATAEEIADVLESAIQRPIPVIPDPVVLREWSVENQISRLVEVVEGAGLRAPVQRS